MAPNAKLDLRVCLYLMIQERPSSDGEKQLITNGLHSCSQLLGDLKKCVCEYNIQFHWNFSDLYANFICNYSLLLLRTLVCGELQSKSWVVPKRFRKVIISNDGSLGFLTFYVFWKVKRRKQLFIYGFDLLVDTLIPPDWSWS